MKTTAHHLTLHRAFVADHFHDLPGFVEARHGHNWEIQATVVVREPGDAVRAEEALDRWVADVDYQLLNDRGFLEGRNPTAEALAEHALLALEAAGLLARRVKVREKAHYWAACARKDA